MHVSGSSVVCLLGPLMSVAEWVSELELRPSRKVCSGTAFGIAMVNVVIEGGYDSASDCLI